MAGAAKHRPGRSVCLWIPAFAGMTVGMHHGVIPAPGTPDGATSHPPPVPVIPGIPPPPFPASPYTVIPGIPLHRHSHPPTVIPAKAGIQKPPQPTSSLPPEPRPGRRAKPRHSRHTLPPFPTSPSPSFPRKRESRSAGGNTPGLSPQRVFPGPRDPEQLVGLHQCVVQVD